MKDNLKDFIIKTLEEKKADNINCMQLSGDVSIAEYMIFATGRSSKNIMAMAENLAYELKHKMQHGSNIEGLKTSDWIVIDVGSVVVHLFNPESRDNLKLEDLWLDKLNKQQT